MQPGCGAFQFVSIPGLWRRCGRGRRNGTASLFAVISWGLFRDLGLPWKLRRAVSMSPAAGTEQRGCSLQALHQQPAAWRRACCPLSVRAGLPASPWQEDIHGESPLPRNRRFPRLFIPSLSCSRVESMPGVDHTMRAASGGEDAEPPDPDKWQRPRHPPAPTAMRPACSSPPQPLRAASVVPAASPTQI